VASRRNSATLRFAYLNTREQSLSGGSRSKGYYVARGGGRAAARAARRRFVPNPSLPTSSWKSCGRDGPALPVNGTSNEGPLRQSQDALPNTDTVGHDELCQ
jgi:hypothetical protein